MQMIEEEEVEVPVSKVKEAADVKEDAEKVPSGGEAKMEDAESGSTENGAPAEEKTAKLETDTPKVTSIQHSSICRVCYMGIHEV